VLDSSSRARRDGDDCKTHNSRQLGTTDCGTNCLVPSLPASIGQACFWLFLRIGFVKSSDSRLSQNLAIESIGRRYC
jgi:hypothetical protein